MSKGTHTQPQLHAHFWAHTHKQTLTRTQKASRLSVAKPGDGPRHPNLPSHYDGIQSIQLTQEEMKKQV